jgi:tRNA threonylcarbamoyl adenosine modification protein YjeE
MNLSEAELARWGEVIGAEVRAPMFVLFRGPLGAGKSVLARAIARGAGVEGAIPSPTFNILFRYPTSRGIQIVHLDLYRVSEPGELWELGWQELGAPDELVLVEWPERAEEQLPRDRWEVTLAHIDGDPDSRSVEVNRVGRPPHLPGFPVSLSA